MTAKEELLRKAQGWSEHEAEVALKAVGRESPEPDDVAGDWGDLSSLRAALDHSPVDDDD
jgi:hypothetical protein